VLNGKDPWPTKILICVLVTISKKTVYVWASITAAINVIEDVFRFYYLILIL